MAWEDTSDPAAQDWFAANAPPPADPFADQVNALYQKYYHTDAPAEAIQAHRGNPGGLPAIEQMLKESAPPSVPTAEGTPPSPSAPSGPPTLNRHDPASVSAYVNYYADQPGANQSLKNDPNYWIGKISSGELGDDPKYIVSKFMLPEGAPAGSPGGLMREAGGGFGVGQPDYVTPPPTYASNAAVPTPPPAPAPASRYIAPTWSGGPPPAAPAPFAPYTAPTWSGGPPTPPRTLTPFTPPTQTDLEASPGYRARFQMAMDASQASAAQRGSILSGGYQKELTRDASDYASNEYSKLFGQGLATNQANNAATQTGNVNNLQDYFARYGQFTDAANLGMGARQQNAGETAAGFNRAQQVYGTGYGQFTDAANLGLMAQQQNVSQGNTAFNQGQQTYQNRYASYLDQNTRTLTDYLTNLNARRNQANDYWSHLNDLYQTGATVANNSYKQGIGPT